MKNRLLIISIGILLTFNACFPMNDPKEDARRTIYELIKEWQKTKAGYDKKRAFYKQQLDNGVIGAPVYRQRKRAAHDDEVLDFMYIDGEIQRALRNHDLPERVMKRLRIKHSLSQQEIYDLVEKHYR